MDAPSIPIRHADRTGAVVRKAIEWISGDRSQIGGASGHSHSDCRDRIVAAALIAGHIVTVSRAVHGGILSRRRPVRSRVGAGSFSDGAAALVIGAGVGALVGCAGAVMLGVGAGSEAESARAPERADNETRAA